jgi:mono/diheme cytochrome c family protein
MASLIVVLAGCYDMHDQPSYKAQEGPRLQSPEDAVPVQGKETYSKGEALINPMGKTDESVKRGRRVYEINCAMCHGPKGLGDGPVGKQFLPQPPSLHSERIHRLSDADIFKRITSGWGTMPAFKTRIDPEDRWNVVNAVRDFRESSGAP